MSNFIREGVTERLELEQPIGLFGEEDLNELAYASMGNEPDGKSRLLITVEFP